MPHYKYLIIGGGMTADSAVRGIREADPGGEIGLIGAETDPPYDRPPLSKGLWKGEPEEKIDRGTEKPGVELHLGREATAFSLKDRRVSDDRGEFYTFEKLLLATGGVPRRLPGGGDGIIYFRTLSDYRRLRAAADRGRSFAVIGGGFIGSEIAAALRMNDKEVAMIFPGEGIGSGIYPRDLSLHLNEYYRGRGVEVLAGETVESVSERAGRFVIRTRREADGKPREFAADGVVAGIGIRPDIRLAEKAGLPTGDGIVVDERLRAGHPDVFAAGDVASFPSAALGRRLRVEHEDNANAMGRAAGRSMAGTEEPYRHLPFFYSDLFDLGYEAVGELDARLETFVDWREPWKEGVVYYLRDGRVRGVLLWNVWHQVDAARELIASPGPFLAADLKGRLGKRAA
jgi:3-phenylpropionate/trans-cinnamate dioxygenase ferredoxin reductase subunit